MDAIERATEIVNASEWSGDMRVNMTRVIGAGRVLAKALAERGAEIERLRDLIPDPRQLSGWDDDGCPPDVAAMLIDLAEAKGIEVPEYLEAAKAAGGDDAEGLMSNV